MEYGIHHGADIVVQRCLRVARGERVHLLVYRANEVATTLAAAIARAGGDPVRVDLEDYEDPGAMVLAESTIRSALAGASATMFVSGVATPSHLSLLVVRVVQRVGARHLHLAGVTPRLLAESLCADPDRVAELNARVAERLKPPTTVRVTSEAGTALRIVLSEELPLLSANGRPTPDDPENLPSGFVFAHPARLDGVYLADRGLLGTGLRTPPAAVRRHPARFVFEDGRMTTIDCDDTTIIEEVERYRTLHPNADRVALVSVPTNYLVRQEVGVDVQDALLPGMSLLLGFSQSARTGAPFDAPVQMRMHGRALTIESDHGPLITAGQFDPPLLRGVDPYQ